MIIVLWPERARPERARNYLKDLCSSLLEIAGGEELPVKGRFAGEMVDLLVDHCQSYHFFEFALGNRWWAHCRL